jgi:asparagine N-glycosylation enzyme membrane subunit Stt3
VPLIASLVLLTLALLPLPALAWNIPGHMLSAAIAYQVLQQENPPTIEKVKAVLEKHPWYTNQWQSRLQDVAICLALVIIGNENDVQKRERATNRVANK